MASLNQVNIIGNVTASPKMKALEDGTKIANVSIATNEFWKDKATGEKKQKAEFHNVVAFGKLAELFELYTQAGSLVFVTGKIETRKWTDLKTNQKMNRTEIIASGLQFLSKTEENTPAPTIYTPSVNPSDLPF